MQVETIIGLSINSSITNGESFPTEVTLVYGNNRSQSQTIDFTVQPLGIADVSVYIKIHFEELCNLSWMSNVLRADCKQLKFVMKMRTEIQSLVDPGLFVRVYGARD